MYNINKYHFGLHGQRTRDGRLEHLSEEFQAAGTARHRSQHQPKEGYYLGDRKEGGQWRALLDHGEVQGGQKTAQVAERDPPLVLGHHLLQHRSESGEEPKCQYEEDAGHCVEQCEFPGLQHEHGNVEGGHDEEEEA